MEKRANGLMEPAVGEVFTSAAVLVSVGGVVTLDGWWGDVRDPVFDLASITKLFTTSALLRGLAVHGLDIDIPVVDVIDEFGRSGPRPIGARIDPITREEVSTQLQGTLVDPTSVTIRQILTHTSGLPPWLDLHTSCLPPPPATSPETSTTRRSRYEQGLATLWDLPFAFVPGTDVAYSDIGMIIAGDAASRLLGTSIEDAAGSAGDLVSSTLGFHPTEHGIPLTRIAPTEADTTWRHRLVHGEVHDENAAALGGVAGHAGLFGTAADLARFGEMWLRGDARLGIGEPLVVEARRHAVGHGDDRRGMGWRMKPTLTPLAGRLTSPETFGHTGFTGCSVWIDPSTDLVVVFLTNAVHFGRDFTRLGELRQELMDRIVLSI